LPARATKVRLADTRRAAGPGGSDRRGLRRHLLRLGRGDLSNTEPEEILGSFDQWSAEARDALAEVIEEDERWRLRGRDLGAGHRLLVRALGVRSLPGHGVIRILEALVRNGPSQTLRLLYRCALECQSRFSPHPSVAAILRRLHVDPRDLAICYARGLAQPFAYRGFWHDARRHITVGSTLGLDFIVGPEGVWFGESNLKIGLEPDRTALYEHDPFVANLVGFACENGYRRLVLLLHRMHMDNLMTRQLQEESAHRGVELTIVEDAFLAKSRYVRSYRIPEVPDRTLIARVKSYGTNLDYLLKHKGASARALRIYRRETGDSTFLLPDTGHEPPETAFDPGDPFPNVVFKFPERDAGTGIFLLKATSPAHARAIVEEAIPRARSKDFVVLLRNVLDDHRGLYQSYVRGFLVGGRRLYKVRAHVLLTPIGSAKLSAHRTVSAHEVPRELPPGIVMDPRPFVVNHTRGAKYTLLPPEEEPPIWRAALGVARGLGWAASHGFRTGPREERPAT
jgi:hypothetical protein